MTEQQKLEDECNKWKDKAKRFAGRIQKLEKEILALKSGAPKNKSHDEIVRTKSQALHQ